MTPHEPPLMPVPEPAVVIVAIGQCGITVAHDFYSRMADPHNHPRFFTRGEQTRPAPAPSRKRSQTAPPLHGQHQQLDSSLPTGPAIQAQQQDHTRSFRELTRAERDARIRAAVQTTTGTMSSSSNPPLAAAPNNDGMSNGPWFPRCVLLDAEPKVIRSVLDCGGPMVPSPPSPAAATARAAGRKRAWRYHPKCAHWRAAGAANNWAYGYHRHGASMYALVARGVRAQVNLAREQNSTGVAGGTGGLAGIVVMHSVAGGTGSGLGTYITERLRAEYPDATIVNQVVWPFARGEVVVQNLNLVLTMARLLRASSLILVFFNDHLQRICTDRLGLPSASFADLNGVLATLLYQLLLPARSTTGVSRPATLGDMAAALRSPPPPGGTGPTFAPIATAYYVPQVPATAAAFTPVTVSWAAALRPLAPMVLGNLPTDEGLDWRLVSGAADAHSVGAAVLLLREACEWRRTERRAAESDARAAAIADPKMYSHSTARLTVWTGGAASELAGEVDKWAAIVCTTTAIKATLTAALQSSVNMIRSGAFLHQYMQYGMQAEDFQQAIATVYTGAVHNSMLVSIPSS
ncbi:Tubulin/FtsZ, GTPase domain-containing protein [Blastocladiella britannica]|nr:Tubulin/FtsZ, GTPase domain-containing protein [Blastocladiella britannica]